MNVPKLRFKEFNDEYKKYTFAELADYKKGPFGSALKKEIFVPKSENSVKVYEQQNAIKKDWTLERYFITKEYYKKLKGFTIGPGDIIVSCAGTIGEYYVLPNEAEIGVINQALMRIITNKKVNQNYFLYIFDNMIYNFSKTFSNGSAIKNIPPFADLKKQIAYIPTIEEQNKVSIALKLLDKKIELQSKKIEDLKLFKSSQIINFFNKNNFAEVYIKNIGFFQSGNSLSKDCLTSSGVPIILYGDLYTKYNEVIKKVEQYTNDNKKYIKSKQNQIIFPTSTTVNSLSLISPSSINLGGIIYGGDILILNLNKDVNADFLSYEINHYKKKEFSKIAQGSTIIHIHAEDLLNCKIALPNIVLQDKFALTFNKLNQKIELENNKLNKLQKLKKGLMQSMFV